MAAEVLLDAGRRVLLLDAKPSLGRKFLMAGKADSTSPTPSRWTIS